MENLIIRASAIKCFRFWNLSVRIKRTCKIGNKKLIHLANKSKLLKLIAYFKNKFGNRMWGERKMELTIISEQRCNSAVLRV